MSEMPVRIPLDYLTKQERSWESDAVRMLRHNERMDITISDDILNAQRILVLLKTIYDMRCEKHHADIEEGEQY